MKNAQNDCGINMTGPFTFWVFNAIWLLQFLRDELYMEKGNYETSRK